MKALYQLVLGLLLVVLLLTGCRSKAFLNKSSSKLKLDHETISIRSEESTASTSTIFTRQFSDSSGFDYQVRIFPIDTFRFSMDQGFVGVAGEVRISGRSSRVVGVKDSVVASSESDKRVEEEMASSTGILHKEEEKVKQKEGSRMGFIPLIILGLVIFVIYWNVRRFTH